MYLQSIKLQSESPHCWADRCQSFKVLSNITLCIYLFYHKWHFVTIPLRGSIKIIFLPVNSTQNKTLLVWLLEPQSALGSWKLDLFILPDKISNCPMLDMSSKVTDAFLNDKLKIKCFLLLSLNLEVESYFSKFISQTINIKSSSLPPPSSFSCTTGDTRVLRRTGHPSQYRTKKSWHSLSANKSS